MIARLTTDYNKPFIVPRTDCCLLFIALLLAIASTNTFAVVPTVSGVRMIRVARASSECSGRHLRSATT